MTSIKKRLGYGGSGIVNGTQVLITSGSIMTSNSPSYLEMLYAPPTSTKVQRVQHALGIVEYSASIGFDVDDVSVGMFSSDSNGLLNRFTEVNACVNDGNFAVELQDAKITSITLNGSAGGLITAQLSMVGLSIADGTVTNNFNRDVVPSAYWYSGTNGNDIRDWSLTMNQEVTTMYRNTSSEYPGYLKVGLVSYVLTVNSYKYILPTNRKSISIGTKSWTLTGNTTSEGFSFGGQTDLGMYSYTFETSSQTGSADGLAIVGT